MVRALAIFVKRRRPTSGLFFVASRLRTSVLTGKRTAWPAARARLAGMVPRPRFRYCGVRRAKSSLLQFLQIKFLQTEFLQIDGQRNTQERSGARRRSVNQYVIHEVETPAVVRRGRAGNPGFGGELPRVFPGQHLFCACDPAHAASSVGFDRGASALGNDQRHQQYEPDHQWSQLDYNHRHHGSCHHHQHGRRDGQGTGRDYRQRDLPGVDYQRHGGSLYRGYYFHLRQLEPYDGHLSAVNRNHPLKRRYGESLCDCRLHERQQSV
jgi:hypothetical protein